MNMLRISLLRMLGSTNRGRRCSELRTEANCTENNKVLNDLLQRLARRAEPNLPWGRSNKESYLLTAIFQIKDRFLVKRKGDFNKPF